MHRSPCILIVGNEDGLMELIQEQLVKAMGRCVLEFTSALSIACNSLAQTTFDAVLLDLSVANHGQTRALAAIRSVAPKTPVFVLLDRNREFREVDSRGPAARGYLFKDELRHGSWISRLYRDGLRQRGL